MCQAYEGERALIISEEHYAATQGFAAAWAGKLRENPYTQGIYAKQAWEHGFSCFGSHVLPWAIEKIYHEDGSRFGEGFKVSERFREKGTLPEKVLKILRSFDKKRQSPHRRG